MSQPIIWTVLIRCPSGHHFEAEDPLVNVDGHLVLPLPWACERCLGTTRAPTWRERRAMRKAIRRLERGP